VRTLAWSALALWLLLPWALWADRPARGAFAPQPRA
jgi:hypothetical protein